MMAGPNKKLKVVHVSAEQDDSNDHKLQKFLGWCHDNHFNINKKVRVGRHGSCSEYGMIAVGDLDEAECLFEIPRNVLLNVENSCVADIIQSESHRLESNSGWVTIILALMYEYTNPTSLWRPYLDACPDFNVLDHPMFWTREEVEEELKGTGIPECVERDRINIQNEYSDIAMPFIKQHCNYWSLEIHTLDLYTKMVAFIMAYSFTEYSIPIMVPLADILNHVSSNNAHLKFGDGSLRMVTTQPIKQGEEVYNTYGDLPNWQLLHMYGFAESYQKNTFDRVEVDISLMYESAKTIGHFNNIEKKWKWLKRQEIVEDSDKISIDRHGIHGLHMMAIIKVLLSDNKEFKTLKKDLIDESDDEDEEAIATLSKDDLRQAPDTWQQLIYTMVEKQLETYNTSYEDNHELLKKDAFLTSRKRYSLHIRYGQQSILRNIAECCNNKANTKQNSGCKT